MMDLLRSMINEMPEDADIKVTSDLQAWLDHAGRVVRVRHPTLMCGSVVTRVMHMCARVRADGSWQKRRRGLEN